MDLLNIDKIYFNNKEFIMAYYNGKIVWTAARGYFSKDFKNLMEEEEWYGVFDTTKGGFVV